MAVNTKVVRGGKAAAEEADEAFSVAGEDIEEGGDTVLVGGPDEGDGIVADDDSGEFGADEGDGKKKPVEIEVEAEEDEDDARLAYDEGGEADGREREGASRRKRRNDARRQQQTKTEAELAEMRRVVQEQGALLHRLTGGQVQSGIAAVDGQIGTLRQSLEIAKAEIIRAAKENDGEALARAMDLRDEASTRLYQAQSTKQRLMEQGGRVQQQDPRLQQQQRQEPQSDPVADRYGEIFMDRHPWFDPQASDVKSNIVKSIDASLASDGYLANTKLYWVEMENRMKEYGLQRDGTVNRAEGGEVEDERPARAATTRPRGIPPTGAVRSTRSAGKPVFTLSREQTSLLEAEGLLGGKLSKEDTDKRNRIVAKWREGTKQLRNGAAR